MEKIRVLHIKLILINYFDIIDVELKYNKDENVY